MLLMYVKWEWKFVVCVVSECVPTEIICRWCQMSWERGYHRSRRVCEWNISSAITGDKRRMREERADTSSSAKKWRALSAFTSITDCPKNGLNISLSYATTTMALNTEQKRMLFRFLFPFLFIILLAYFTWLYFIYFSRRRRHMYMLWMPAKFCTQKRKEKDIREFSFFLYLLKKIQLTARESERWDQKKNKIKWNKCGNTQKQSERRKKMKKWINLFVLFARKRELHSIFAKIQMKNGEAAESSSVTKWVSFLVLFVCLNIHFNE